MMVIVDRQTGCHANLPSDDPFEGRRGAQVAVRPSASRAVDSPTRGGQGISVNNGAMLPANRLFAYPRLWNRGSHRTPSASSRENRNGSSAHKNYGQGATRRDLS